MSDLTHRVVWTFVEAFLGVLLATTLLGLDVTLLATAAASGLAAALTVVKEYARHQLDRRPPVDLDERLGR